MSTLQTKSCLSALTLIFCLVVSASIISCGTDGSGSKEEVDYTITNPAFTAIGGAGGDTFFGGVAGDTSFNGTFTINNSGSCDGSQDITRTIYRSSNAIYESGDTVIDTGALSSLQSSASSNITFNGDWSSAATGTIYYLIIAISAEDDDNNNTGNNMTVSAGKTVGIFYDGFEDGDWQGWTDSDFGADITVASPGVSSSSYGLSIENPAGVAGLYSGAYKTFPVGITPTYISFYVKSKQDTVQPQGSFHLRDGLGWYILYFYFNIDGMNVNDIRYGGYTTGVWYLVEFKNINWETDQFDFYLNLNPIAIDIPFIYSVTSAGTLDLYNLYESIQSWFDEIIMN